MSTFTIIMGPPCSGKTTKITELYQYLSERYEQQAMPHTFVMKDGSTQMRDCGRYFPEINVYLVGHRNKMGNFTGTDAKINGGVSQDEGDRLFSLHTDKHIITETNYSYSPARKLPVHIAGLGFESTSWVLMHHANKEVLTDRKIKRGIESGRGHTQKSIDEAWGKNAMADRLHERFVKCAQPQDSIQRYLSTDEWDVVSILP